MKRWDVAIIGGGLAGSASAIKLAQSGRKVLLLEKEEAAHDKVCGEFLSIEAQHYLNDLGIDPIALGGVSITGIGLIRNRRTVVTRLPFQALSLSRRILDEAVLLRAKDSGAQVLRGANVGTLTKEPQHWRIEAAGRNPILAETVFLATGKHDLRGWHRASGTQNNFIGFKMHFRLAPQQRAALEANVEMFLFDGGYGGLEPVEDGKANLCLVVSKQHFARYGKNWSELLASILTATPPLAKRLAEAESCWPRPLSIFGVPYGFVHQDKSDVPLGLYRLGDQMAVIPSFFGLGMSMALYTASLATECYLRNDSNSYHCRARSDLLPLIRWASFLAKAAEFPWVQRGIILACRVRPQIIATLAARACIKNLTDTSLITALKH